MVAGAAAEIALECVPDLLLARIRDLRKEADGGHDEPRGAVAALEAVLLVERLLDGVHRPVRRQAFNGRNLVAVRLDAEQRAGLHGLAVQQHRAGAAAGCVAADVCAGQAELLAQNVDEELARLEVEDVLCPVDRDRDLPHRSLLSVEGKPARSYALPSVFASGGPSAPAACPGQPHASRCRGVCRGAPSRGRGRARPWRGRP